MDAVRGDEVPEVRLALETAIVKAGLEADPVAEVLRAMAKALETQKCLHDSTVEQLTGMSLRLGRQYDDTMTQAQQTLDAKRIAVVEGLVPKVAELVRSSVRSWTRLNEIKLAMISGCFAVAVALGVGMACYGAGWQASRAEAIGEKALIEDAMRQQGAAGQAAMAEIVSKNDLSMAWARCQSDIVATTDPRRACRMLLWVDLPPKEPKVKGAG